MYGLQNVKCFFKFSLCSLDVVFEYFRRFPDPCAKIPKRSRPFTTFPVPHSLIILCIDAM